MSSPAGHQRFLCLLAAKTGHEPLQQLVFRYAALVSFFIFCASAMACLLADQHVTARELPDLDAGLATAVAGKSDEVSGEPYTMPARSVRFSRTEIVMEAVTILLADDEALLLMDFEVALADAGFHVTAVTRGGKAIEILRAANAPIDGVVTDIRFGEYPDGWEVARVAREIDPDIPVVYISGHGAVDWASKGVPNSIMIEKPFTSSQLLTAVSQLLNARPPRASQHDAGDTG